MMKIKFFLLLATAAILCSAGSAAAVVKPGQSEILLDTYQRNITNLKTSSFGLPLFLNSFEKNDKVHVDVYGIFDSPFRSVVNVLQVPANWCDIVSLHPNVKACTFREEPGDWLLTFYFGRKFYQAPEEAHQVVPFSECGAGAGVSGHYAQCRGWPFRYGEPQNEVRSSSSLRGQDFCPRQL